MSYIIAIAGKGGTGKTTIAALLVRLLKEQKKGSVLAVDADPNSNLGESLGIRLENTIGSILDDISAHPEKIPSGTPKERFIEFQVQTAVQECTGFDILTMGRPEGPGCYCYVNNCLRNTIGKIVNDYDYVVIDNEAGLEHLSRRTMRSADILLVVSDATVTALKAADRINKLADELKIKVNKRGLLINRSQDAGLEKKSGFIGLEYIGNVPLDDQIARISLNGNSILELENNAAALAGLRKLGDKIWLK